MEPYNTWKLNATSISGGVDISEAVGFHFQVGVLFQVQKKYSKDEYFIFLIIRLSFTNTRVLPSNFGCYFFLEWNSPDILAWCWTSLNHSLDSTNFSIRGYLPKWEYIILLICMVLKLIWRMDIILGVTCPWKTLGIFICFLLVLLLLVYFYRSLSFFSTQTCAWMACDCCTPCFR